MKFENGDQFTDWVCENFNRMYPEDCEEREYTEDDEAELKAFLEIVGAVVYNYGWLEGLKESFESFGFIRRALFSEYMKKEIDDITAAIEIGERALEQYFARASTD